MTRVEDLLQAKGRTVWSISADASVYEAIQMMADRGVGALPVVAAEKPAGIVSERDYARKVILQGKSSKDTPVRDIMTGTVYFVHPEQSIEQCMVLMTDKRIRHLPVLDGEHLAGIVSIGDLVKAVIAEQQIRIEQLESYITGG
jgi:CBS domain-containing protein